MVVTIFGVKNWQTPAALWAGTLLSNKKNLKSRTQLDKPVECASAGEILFLYKIRHLLFFPSGMNSLCSTHWGVEKYYQCGLDEGPLEYQLLWPRGYLTNQIRTLSLCFGVIVKTPGLIYSNIFFKYFFICLFIYF